MFFIAALFTRRVFATITTDTCNKNVEPQEYEVKVEQLRSLENNLITLHVDRKSFLTINESYQSVNKLLSNNGDDQTSQSIDETILQIANVQVYKFTSSSVIINEKIISKYVDDSL